MRYFILFLSVMCLTSSLFAQTKHDAVWLLGYDPNDPVNNFGGSRLDFNVEPPAVSFFEIPFDFTAISMISDSLGQLVLYTNGCEIINSQHQLMENGIINAGELHDTECEWGYPILQGVIALPKPGHSGHYGLFHIRRSTDAGKWTDVLYTEVDALANEGMGRADIVDDYVHVDTLGKNISAVRHANGRDWWIITAKLKSNVYFITYYGPDGPGLTYSQAIGPLWDNRSWSGQSTFSPNGSKYIRTNPYNGLQIFDFDRCAGTLSNAVDIDFPNDTISSSGAAVSPSNRFLYVSASSKIYQFDLEAEDISASRVVVAEYDGFTSPLSTRFYTQMLAPNGKIYITAPSSVNILHIIHQPDLEGLACEVEQHGIILPTLHAFATPNFPHFRLWDIPESPCDTLNINEPITNTIEPIDVNEAFVVYPNPASDFFEIKFNTPETGTIEIFDMNGQLKQEAALAGSLTSVFSTQFWNSGVYIVRLTNKEGSVFQKKLLILSQ